MTPDLLLGVKMKSNKYLGHLQHLVTVCWGVQSPEPINEQQMRTRVREGTDSQEKQKAR